jgi:hypothetical protein
MTTHEPAGFRQGRLLTPETPLYETVQWTGIPNSDAAHVQAVSDMLAEIHLTIWNDRERGAL